MKRRLRFSTFIFWISWNLGKCTCGWSPHEQHHKIESNNNNHIKQWGILWSKNVGLAKDTKAMRVFGELELDEGSLKLKT
jgi:hypothetical protein